MRVVRVYHAGRTPAQRARERALAAAGVDVTLVVPSTWQADEAVRAIHAEPFEIVEAPVVRPNDVNRHRYVDPVALAELIAQRQPDLIDLHEEPFSEVVHQILRILPADLPVVTYTAQNLDKRYPPPFTRWERAAYDRIAGVYPCSRQAASVVRARGYTGVVRVVPLGYDPVVFYPGDQRHDAVEFRLSLVGRLVPEKGVEDAFRVLGEVRRKRTARLLLAGSGPEEAHLGEYARRYGVEGAVEPRAWLSEDAVADAYRASHVVLVPSRGTSRWVEQFGRAVVEAQACGAAVAGYASGTIPEVAAGGAWLAAEGDAIGLARAVTRLATDYGTWSGLARRGLSAVEGKDWSAVAALQVDFYEQALRAGRATARVRDSTTSRAALAEFGPSARTGDNQDRPFAVPILRDQPVVGRALGGVVDFLGRRGRPRTRS